MKGDGTVSYNMDQYINTVSVKLEFSTQCFSLSKGTGGEGGQQLTRWRLPWILARAMSEELRRGPRLRTRA